MQSVGPVANDMNASLARVIRRGLCISCGMCAGLSPNGAVRMREASAQGMLLPDLETVKGRYGTGLELEVCPGKGYPLTRLGEELFPQATHHDYELGRWQHAWGARNTEPRFLENAASGGIMTGIAAHLLDTGRVQGAVVTSFVYGAPGPRARPYLATTPEALLASQGSKYCPVAALEILPQILAFDGALVFLGTPCQIASLRLLQAKRPELRDKVPLTIGNFCGGFRDLRETDTLIRRAGMEPSEVVAFRYRGGGQPGSMRIMDRRGKCAEFPYPAYVRRTGYAKHKRCALCVDATAELADFSCGDAWLPRFQASGKSWSLLVTRSPSASAIAEEMIAARRLEVTEVSPSEIKASQRQNLHTKKTRQRARQRLHRLLGSAIPEFDGGYATRSSGLALELKVYLSHTILVLLERAGLYPQVARLIKRHL